MPPPTVVAVGTVDSSSPWAPAFPAGIVVNDILLWIGESVGGENFTLPAGWAHIDSVSPVVQGVNTQLTVWWRRYDGTGSAPSVTGPTNHGVTRQIAIRGCPLSGNPWNNVTPGTEATSDVSVLYPGTTTSIADCLVLEILACSADVASTAALSGHTNANYTSIAEHIDNFVIAGNGGGIAVWSGIKATAGATGQSTATLIAGAAGFKALMTLAMAPSAGAAGLAIPPIRSAFRSRFGALVQT
jgi:hypothetical protein